MLGYPTEFVLMMNVDAAIDRQERADKGGPSGEDKRRRAETVRADVFRQVQANESGLDSKKLATALLWIKENRRAKAADLVSAASAGRIRLR
ncbi:MAG TPA: hypothetical protein VGB18_02125 [Candidatus Thermoplasmatota archaeon]